MKAPDGNKLAILERLNQGRFLSGQVLGDELGISRAAVAKHIHSLQEMGIDIYKVNGKGYRISRPLSLLSQPAITEVYEQLQGQAGRFEVQPIIDSTNSELMRRIQANNLEPDTVLVAEMQRQGKGRRGRIWQSPFAANLYYSYYWRLDDGMHAAMGLSIAVGLAIYDCLKALYGLEVQLKWPNDVLVAGRKLAGVLVELDGTAEGPCHLVIGIGLNVSMPDNAAQHIDQPWCDLNEFTTELDKNQLVAALTCFLQKRLYQYQRQGLTHMYQQWNDVHAFAGQCVELSSGNNHWRGICEGIDEQGAVVIRVDGQSKRYFGGEISLRATT
ncbi:bifunctional biotin--[acetyl-CoA-carboxylase] ligase/biotin operon repressor BirA [Pseudoalteromonas ruthenica]|uniref:Bifunctional ligase/repressor BirA n=1 Tax=Pseudoalteromonas ruthenica TaxID=151081 RepID=A0A0F4PUT2_9GAMM|nr:bifunctional biotin--[acetyl-CoA-carboxylase] ligase/biotin operon repressor BirA [Pseudoalteromonas ruthenica]KJY97282.1 biotin--[acetyl-CoA-carboxylase] synthetase [Pseudoalteromonas ruthenica]KJY99230.1 biotin--[acetyl-CoA-carboxylase] synthetase [Pseudoalteromonas ruthenica]TMO86316.1 bifunctional biotin--[acetyl-CoA-carboxylase] synthetase/biotin operon repressor [Pseudoalteromonas ruthenica]TMO91053.1 bifunctional biotin--[acetyl-CoA-carboxylase] synthetase/biotin operon repressor [Pse